MAALTDPTSPPSALFDIVVPHSAATARLPSPMQHKHDKDSETKSRLIVNISDITRIHLRCRIQKIYDMLIRVVEEYGTFYYNKHGNPLPQETVDKIMCLYHNRIEHRCIEIGLTVDEEREWDSDDANVMLMPCPNLEKNPRNMIWMTFVSIQKTTMMMLITLTCPLRS